MNKIGFNPVSFLLNLVIGWFFISFLQAAVSSFNTGKWVGLFERFKAIAFFHDKSAAFVNLAIIATIWFLATAIWFTVRSK